MQVLANAWKEIEKHVGHVYLFILLCVAVNTSTRGAEAILRQFATLDPPPPWLPVYSIVKMIYLAAAFSALNAIFFARLGAAIDRPLWKCAGTGDALRRFFLPWFILNLFSTALVSSILAARAPSAQELALLLHFILLLWVLMAVPIGACIMYWGRLDWGAAGEMFAPIARLFPQTLAVLLLNFGQWTLHMSLPMLVPEGLRENLAVLALLDVPFPFLDCIAFAAMWRICMMHRDLDFSTDSDDYDF